MEELPAAVQWAPIIVLAAAVYLWQRIKSSTYSSSGSLRESAQATARRILSEADNWVIVDTETTGIGSTDVVLQIAVIDHRGDVLLDTLVALPPRKRISARAAQTHGITREKLASAPSWPTVRKQLDRIVAGRQCLAYNAEFDQRLIEQTDDAHQFDGDEHQWVDVMPVYNAWRAEWDDKRKKIKWQRLPGGDHTAAGDCRATLKILREMAA